MNIIGNCQKCRQPLTFGDESLATLSRSTYDLLTASERQPAHAGATLASATTTTATVKHPIGLDRLAPAQRAVYDVAQADRLSSNATARVTVPGLPQQHAASLANSPFSAHTRGPAESFVVLDHVAQSLAALPATNQVARLYKPNSASATQASTVAATALSSSSQQQHASFVNNHEDLDHSIAAPLIPRIAQLSNLYQLLSSKSSIDHPLCTECIEQLLTIMAKQLDEGKKERERLLAFEKDFAKRKDEGLVQTKEALMKEIAKYKKAERQAVEELKVVEAQRDELDKQKTQLDEEEAQLAQEEQKFWRDHSTFLLEAVALRERTNALQTRYAHDLRELEKLQKTNVYNDAFCIGQENGIGTINGLRLGRLPNVAVDWPEINAAWGHCLLLLHTIARKFSLTFEHFRLVPMGSFSKIEKITGDKATLELYGSGDFAVTRLLQNRRFDMAMVAFLDCLKQIGDHVSQRDQGLKLQHKIVKDKIGDVSIKLQFGSDEIWTRALRHVLYDLKLLLGRACL
ncbi:Vacuolar protein sorting-associated protein atg6 [Microbotryomycetes sp. JL221]|nr:Vacuolar protein sorting-associated protein atg6 [Microbotryomycetes sp. JL221]